MDIKLLFFYVILALVPVIANGQSVFDSINPFFYFYYLIVQFLNDFICGTIQDFINNLVGVPSYVSCTCSLYPIVVVLVPTAVTGNAQCSIAPELAGQLSTDNEAVVSGMFDANIDANIALVVNVKDFVGELTTTAGTTTGSLAGSANLNDATFAITTCSVTYVPTAGAASTCMCSVCETDATKVTYSCNNGGPSGTCVTPSLTE